MGLRSSLESLPEEIFSEEKKISLPNLCSMVDSMALAIQYQYL